MTDIPDLSAGELSRAYARKELSPLEATEKILARIEAYEPKLQAMWIVDHEGARASARLSEARWRKGEPLGPLDGVTVTIKENVATRGVPVPMGTAATELKPAEEDAPASARLKEAGAVVLGKTTMPDYGMLSSGLSSFHRLSRNPWDLSKNPGGSSAGAGAAGAAGYGPLHVGTDIGGSIRLPAGWCALAGLKPSFGRVPVDPPWYGRVVGPMTRTVEDTALMMSVLSLPDASDTMCLPPQEIHWARLEREVKGLRLGLWMDAGIGSRVAPEVRAAIEEAGRRFEAAGAIVEPMAPFLTREMLDGLDKFWRTRFFIDFEAMPEARRQKILPFIREWVEGARGLDGVTVFRGFSQMGAMATAACKATEKYDFVLSPTSPMPAFPAEHAMPVNDPKTPFEHIGFTVAFNMSGQPAVSVNGGYTAAGLPIGLQIIGRRFDDLGVLQMARAWEEMRPAQRPWPRF
jgi:aspartyl-tRNA(Asn)/glutamyl-tRNA(Gln) amidotransferase subunit A